MSQASIICKNCENHFTGHYCNNCGQKASIHRIDFKHVLHDLLHAFTHLDKGLFYTAKLMLVEPGHTIRDYLNGKRVRHPNPFLMLLIIGGLCSLTYYNLELTLVNSFKITELDGGIHAIDSKFFAVLFISYSLLLSLFDFIFFKYKGYNYTELFTLNVFISVQILLAQLSLVPLWLIGKNYAFNDYMRIIVALVFMAYLVFVRYQFFEVKNSQKDKLRLYFESSLFILLFFASSYKTLQHISSSL